MPAVASAMALRASPEVAAPRWNVTVTKSSYTDTCLIKFPELEVTVRKVSDNVPDLDEESEVKAVTKRGHETFTIGLRKNNMIDLHYRKWIPPVGDFIGYPFQQTTMRNLDQQDLCRSLYDEIMSLIEDEVSEETCDDVAAHIVNKHRGPGSEHDAGEQWMRQYLIGMKDKWGLGTENSPLFPKASHRSSPATEAALDELRKWGLSGTDEGLVDVGANIATLSDGLLVQQLRRSWAAGVRRIVVTGTSVRRSKWAEELCRVRVDEVMGSDKAHRPQLFFTAGVHPHEVKNCDENTIAELRQLAASPYCVAIGECGLDYDRMFSTRESQLDWFDKQVASASELHMPLFLHERDRGRGGGPLGSDQDCLRILSKHRIDPKLAVFHCFTGSRQVAQEYMQKGYWIGLTGTVAVAKALAELMNVSVEEVAEMTTGNVLKLFPKISQVDGDEHPSDDEGFCTVSEVMYYPRMNCWRVGWTEKGRPRHRLFRVQGGTFLDAKSKAEKFRKLLESCGRVDNRRTVRHTRMEYLTTKRERKMRARAFHMHSKGLF
ncbi:hypothetical protein FOZ61_002789 [Perkinsus olseni]|uniref:TatD DNase n=1 Tax=Perkinsus olseni TaxID=32597 RepID=A0A7J6LS25_PEROL|nr:hypothetical protein FOZ61_002789 [Perkinsus olseni]